MRPYILPLLILAACSNSDNSDKNAEPAKDGATIVDQNTMDSRLKEPDAVTVDHILISFGGAGTKATRSLEDAKKLASDILDQLRNGADWSQLKPKYSDDPGPDGRGGGPYSMLNSMERKRGNRGGMVPAFGNVGFKLNVGEIGVAGFDPRNSPYGWHIIKRVK
ncbi:MAG: peptidylprolyl isomerase [Planctomycetota bacterium]|jgi:hypothetical protein